MPAGEDGTHLFNVHSGFVNPKTNPEGVVTVHPCSLLSSFLAHLCHAEHMNLWLACIHSLPLPQWGFMDQTQTNPSQWQGDSRPGQDSSNTYTQTGQ